MTDLGFTPLADTLGVFAEGTVVAIEAFQHSRGLPITGHADGITWSRLIEAGWRLGQRLLYLARPNLRGDDVAELQVRLAQLGFNPGRIDGIFGPTLEHALIDFQDNRGLVAHGTLSRATLLELTRMTPATAQRSLVTEARDLAGFTDETPGTLIIAGDSPLASLVVSALGASVDVRHLPNSTTDEVAEFANTHGAVVVVNFQTNERLNGVHLHYWASYHSHSWRGEQLASAIATGLSSSQHLPRVEVTGMALPILRETAMTTLHIEHGAHPEPALQELAVVISSILGKVIHR